jgi:hypothetical protein
MLPLRFRPIRPEDDPAVAAIIHTVICQPLGSTGHFGCDRWYTLELGEEK